MSYSSGCTCSEPHTLPIGRLIIGSVLKNVGLNTTAYGGGVNNSLSATISATNTACIQYGQSLQKLCKYQPITTTVCLRETCVLPYFRQKVVSYSTTSVGHEADPGFLAVSPQKHNVFNSNQQPYYGKFSQINTKKALKVKGQCQMSPKSNQF